MSTRSFVDLWGEGDNSFAIDPPNAVLSFAELEDRTPEEVVLTIRKPNLDGDSLTYEVDVLDGALPASTGPCVLVHRPHWPPAITGVGRRYGKARPPPPHAPPVTAFRSALALGRPV